MEEDVLIPSRVIQKFTLQSIKDGILIGVPFRYIMLFETREEAEEALQIARELNNNNNYVLYYRPICYTRDSKWRLYISNHKLQTYSILK